MDRLRRFLNKYPTFASLKRHIAENSIRKLLYLKKIGQTNLKHERLTITRNQHNRSTVPLKPKMVNDLNNEEID